MTARIVQKANQMEQFVRSQKGLKVSYQRAEIEEKALVQ